MSCWNAQLTEEEKRLDFLLCPLKSFTSSEQKFFSLAALCDPYSWKHTGRACGNNDGSSDCCPETRHSSSNSGTKYNQHCKSAALQDIRETSVACHNANQSCQTNVDTQTGEGKHKHTKPEDSTDTSVPAAAVETNGVRCHTCDDQSFTSSTLFVPLPNIPSLLLQQNYSKWKAVMDNHLRLRQVRRHNTIYIQPLDDFPEFINSRIGSGNDTMNGTTVGGFFELLREYLKVFFSGLNVVIQPTAKTAGSGWTVKSRHHHMTGKKQLLVGDIHKCLKKILPKDGCCIVGVTWTDLYPCEDLNFVLGEASVEHRCAAFCFGRFEPKCYVDGKEPAQIEDIDGSVVWKMLKVISHETCHVFNMAHCVHFECLMNGSSSLAEMLQQPNFLCPVCLCKLKKVTRCNIAHRYRQLFQFYTDVHKLFPSTSVQSAIAWLKEVLTFFD